MVPRVDVTVDSPRRLYLVGFMGAGKSTVGRTLADRLGWDFVELDAEIEGVAGRTIPAIFREEGEPAFRDLEHRVLRRVSRREPPCVVACGGGVPLSERNRRILMETGLPVHLMVRPETVLERLDQDGSRPLLPGGDRREERLKRLWQERQDAYNAFDRSVVTDDRSVDDVVDRVLALLDGIGT